MSLILRRLVSVCLFLLLILGFQNCGESGGPLKVGSNNNSSENQDQQNEEEATEEEETATPTPTPEPPAFSASHQSAAVEDQISYGLIQTADGGFLSGGTMTNDPAAVPVGSTRDIQVIKWNTDGTPAYNRKIATDRNDQIWSVHETANHYLLAGFSWVRPNDVYRGGGGLLVRVNKNDGSVFQTDLYHSAGEAWDQWHVMKAFTDAQGNASYIVSGLWQQDTTTEDQATLVAKLDSNFNVVWARSYGIAGEAHIGRDIIHVANQGFYVVGRRKILPNVRDDIIILKISEDGTLIAAKEYVNLQGFDVAHSVVWNNGELVVSGVARNIGFGGGDGVVIRLDANLNLLGSYVIGGSSFDNLNNVKVSKSGDLIFAGTTESVGNGFNDSWVLSLDSNFQFKWSTVLGKIGDDTIEKDSLVERIDGGIAAVSTENRNQVKNGDMSSRNSRLVLLSQYGKIESGCTGVYPNQVFGMQSVVNPMVQDLPLVTATQTYTRTQLTLAAVNANAVSSNTCQ